VHAAGENAAAVMESVLAEHTLPEDKQVGFILNSFCLNINVIIFLD